MSSLVTAPRRAGSRSRGATPSVRVRGRSTGADLLIGLAFALVVIVVSLAGSGGVDLAPNTWIQVALVALTAAVATALVVLSPARPLWGGTTLLLFGGLAALTYASIGWSVQPANSWLEANRTLSYLGAFATAAGLARMWPGRWRAVVGGIATAATAISLYALIVKVFPATLDAGDPLGRLRAPFDYWSAVGLMAAMGIPACLWAGARRDQAPALRALTVPAIAILIPALLLSYSRGALIVAVVGTAFWFALVPLRLRGALILAVGAAGGAAISIWALSTRSITADGVAIAARTGAGHSFGLVLLVVLALATAAGFATAFATDRVRLSPRLRRRTGTVLIALAALLPVAGVAALAASSRGLTGEVSHIWSTLTNPNGVVGDQPGRLVQLSNSRPHYWSEALKIGEHHLLAGVGALGFSTAQGQYTSGVWNTVHAHVDHAHGYLLETFADFGLIGIALSVALLVAWLVAAGRALGVCKPARLATALRAPPAEYAAEHAGLLTLAAVVLTFGLHSLIDWTWFIPGTTVPALVAAGWLAGRGPLEAPVGRLAQRRRLARSPAAAAIVAAIVVAAVAAAWGIVQPLRSADAYDSAVTELTRGNTGAALTDARQAQVSDPVSVDPLWLLAVIHGGAGDHAAARHDLVKATSVQPSNPETWQRLGCYDLGRDNSAASRAELARARALAPGQTQITTDPAGFCASVDA
jgi:O-Antigen ligase